MKRQRSSFRSPSEDVAATNEKGKEQDRDQEQEHTDQEVQTATSSKLTDARGEDSQGHLPGLRHLTSQQVRWRPRERATESIEDYHDFFHDLQIDPAQYQVFWSEVIYRYRQSGRHMPLLRRGTDASMKNMNDDLLRAYGERIWGEQSTWRRCLEEGESSLLYEKGQTESRLYEILTAMWWRMRELIFEEKTAPKPRGGDTALRSSLKKTSEILNRPVHPEGKSKSVRFEPTISSSNMTRDRTKIGSDPERAAALRNLKHIVENQNECSEDGKLSAWQVENAIFNIASEVHALRVVSDPQVFEHLWAAHISRVEEWDTSQVFTTADEHKDSINNGRSRATEPRTSKTDGTSSVTSYVHAGEKASKAYVGEDSEGQTFPAGLEANTLGSPRSAVAEPPTPPLHSIPSSISLSHRNLSNEPFNTHGSPIPRTLTQQRLLPPTLPEVMSVWISTFPPRSQSVANVAYHHPAMPVREQDMPYFYRRLMERVDHIAPHQVQGYAVSYGWCDVTRWIPKTLGRGFLEPGGSRARGGEAGYSDGEKEGWFQLQEDLIDAAKKGVAIWRMKVLVVKKQ